MADVAKTPKYSNGPLNALYFETAHTLAGGMRVKTVKETLRRIFPEGDPVVQPGEFNEPFFDAIAQLYLDLKEGRTPAKALELTGKIVGAGLEAAYGESDEYGKGRIDVFKRVVGERDRSLGVESDISSITDSFVYQIPTNLFPRLQGEVDPFEFDRKVHVNTKIRHVLGGLWRVENIRHIQQNGVKSTAYMVSR